MAVQGPAALISALEARRFDEITGTPESEWVDFKRAAYQHLPDRPLRLSKRGRWELAKDVAELANKSGGCLVLGIEEVESPALGVKVAGNVVAIRVDSIDIAHYRDVIQRDAYPPISGIEIIWYPDGDPAAGVLLINVPSSNEGLHVLRRIVTENGIEIEAVGVPVRNADRTIWYSAERIHHLISQAERTHVAPSAPVPSPGGDWERADRNRDRLVSLQDWDEEAFYVMQAVPSGGLARIEGFYDSVKEALESPPSLRSAGFNMRGLGGLVDVISGVS